MLVAYSSKRGATREIAAAIGATLRSTGLLVDVADVRDVPAGRGYDAVVVGSAISRGRWRRPAVQFLQLNRRELGEVPVWLFQQDGWLGEDNDVAQPLPDKVAALARDIGALETATFRNGEAITAWALQVGDRLTTKVA